MPKLKKSSATKAKAKTTKKVASKTIRKKK